MSRGRVRLALPIVLALTGVLATGARKTKTEAPSVAAPFDYYLLSLSWAPDFCAQPGAATANPKECAPGSGTGFVVHGLWPEAAQGKSPESCGPDKPLAKNVVNAALHYMPSASLIQHEWAVHGTCTGLPPADYFFEIAQARAAIQIPVQMISIEAPLSESPARIEGEFAAANSMLPPNAFRAICRNGALSEVRVCFDKNLKPVKCLASAGECPDPAINILPLR